MIQMRLSRDVPIGELKLCLRVVESWYVVECGLVLQCFRVPFSEDLFHSKLDIMFSIKVSTADGVLVHVFN